MRESNRKFQTAGFSLISWFNWDQLRWQKWAAFEKLWFSGRRYFSRLRCSWRLHRQISFDYITTVPPPNLTRLLHNTASNAGYEQHCCSWEWVTFVHCFNHKITKTVWTRWLDSSVLLYRLINYNYTFPVNRKNYYTILPVTQAMSNIAVAGNE